MLEGNGVGGGVHILGICIRSGDGETVREVVLTSLAVPLRVGEGKRDDGAVGGVGNAGGFGRPAAIEDFDL